MDLFEQYKNIIGLTQEDCPEQSENRPLDYNTSLSGLYLDELVLIQGAMKIGLCDSDWWAIVNRAVQAAIKGFVADANALLIKEYKPKRPVVKGQVFGETKARDIYDSDLKNYGVVRLSCAPIRGGFFRLNSLGTIFEETGAVDVSLYDNVNGLIESFTLNTTANKHTINPIGKSYPMYSKYARPLEYQLVITYPASNAPKDNKLNCGCGNWEPKFNCNDPYTYAGNKKAVKWANYVMVGGNDINSISELDELPDHADLNMRGLTIDADFYCSNAELINGGMDFVANPLALSAALAIRYLAGVYVAKEILKSPLLERENMVAQEDWEDSEIEWFEQYKNHVAYLVQNINLSANDCLSCRSMGELTTSGIFS